ncbi:MAG: 3-methyl-2-oxobutanoate hydroxymethyltransferase, partial [Candidatus Zixiibacteriota bacterium]
MAKDKITVKTFLRMKESKEKIAVLTAYDFFTARILDSIGIDCILVGDSVNMVFYGAETTLSIGMDQMIYHTRAVSSACEKAMI